MNKTRIKKVLEHIGEVPERLDMNTVFSVATPGDTWRSGGFKARHLREWKVPSCGTVGCFAGWTDELFGEHNIFHSLSAARGLLGLTEAQASRLFTEPKLAFDKSYKSEHVWPKDLALKYLDAKTPKGRFLALKARVERFLRTNGKK
jgi:hypothetical protein